VLDKVSSGLLADSFSNHEEAELILDNINGEDLEGNSHNTLVLGIFQLGEEQDALLDSVTLTVSHGEVLNSVAHLVHHNLELVLTLLGKSGHSCHKNTVKFSLTESEKISQYIELCHVHHRPDLVLYVKLGLRQLEFLILHVSHVIFDDLCHQNTVVTLSSQAGVSNSKVVAEFGN